VDDNSPDKTYEVFINIKNLFLLKRLIKYKIIEELQKFYSEEKLKLLKRPGKLGLGTAYIDGAKYSKGDFIFLMDADFSHHV